MKYKHDLGLVYDRNRKYHKYCKRCNLKIFTVKEYVKSLNSECNKFIKKNNYIL